MVFHIMIWKTDFFTGQVCDKILYISNLEKLHLIKCKTSFDKMSGRSRKFSFQSFVCAIIPNFMTLSINFNYNLV